MTWQTSTIDPSSTTPATDITKIKNDLQQLRAVMGGDTDADIPSIASPLILGSVAALRGLSKTQFSRAITSGYYTPGDGGAGWYYLDATDTTSADNGGTVIVATDGGRWKLVHLGTFSFTQFGAKVDGSTDDTAKCNAAIKAMYLLGAGRITVGKKGTMYIAGTLLHPDYVELDLTGAVLKGTGSNNIIETAYWNGSALVSNISEFGAGGPDDTGTHLVSKAKILGGRFQQCAIGIRGNRYNYNSTIEGVTFDATCTYSADISASWGMRFLRNLCRSPSRFRKFVDWTVIESNDWEGIAGNALSIESGFYSTKIQSNGFHNCGTGLYFTGEGNDCEVSNNHFEVCGALITGATGTKTKFYIHSNWLKASNGTTVSGIVFNDLNDSLIDVCSLVTDGTTTWSTIVGLNTDQTFGNRVVMPFNASASPALSLSGYSVRDTNCIEFRGGSTDNTKTQPVREHWAGSGTYTFEKYRSRYREVANTIPYCTCTTTTTTITIDCSHLPSSANGIRFMAEFSLIITGSTNTYIICGRLLGLRVITDVKDDFFAGTAASGVSISASNNGGTLRLTITGLNSGSTVTGWIKQK